MSRGLYKCFEKYLERFYIEYQRYTRINIKEDQSTFSGVFDRFLDSKPSVS